MTDKLIWLNSTTSGLCDRMMDLTLMATLAKLINTELHLEWKEHPPLNDFQKSVWPIERLEDYKIENFKKFFSLPDHIKFTNNLNELDSSGIRYYFTEYLGGVFNSKTFHSRYAANICDFSSFQREYEKTLNDFKFLEEQRIRAEGYIPTKIDLGIHLRRTDKITNSPDSFQITMQQLDDLENKTINFLSSQLRDNEKTISVFLCSDNQTALSNFKENFKSHDNVCFYSSLDHVGGIEKTYFDIHFLSRCDVILMSQKHSNFSIFSSLIGNKKLVYLYKNDLIDSGYFPEFKFHKDDT